MNNCITFPAGERVIPLHESLIDICAGSHCVAAVLNQFIYWTSIKLESNKQAQIQNDIRKNNGLDPNQDITLWVYKTQEDLAEELLHLPGTSEKKIKEALDFLTETMQCLDKRHDPKYTWNRTLQYRLDIEQTQFYIDIWKALHSAPVRNASRKNAESNPQKSGINSANMRDQTRTGAGTISENTTENTIIEITPESVCVNPPIELGTETNEDETHTHDREREEELSLEGRGRPGTPDQENGEDRPNPQTEETPKEQKGTDEKEKEKAVPPSPAPTRPTVQQVLDWYAATRTYPIIPNTSLRNAAKALADMTTFTVTPEFLTVAMTHLDADPWFGQNAKVPDLTWVVGRWPQVQAAWQSHLLLTQHFSADDPVTDAVSETSNKPKPDSSSRPSAFPLSFSPPRSSLPDFILPYVLETEIPVSAQEIQRWRDYGVDAVQKRKRVEFYYHTKYPSAALMVFPDELLYRIAYGTWSAPEDQEIAS